MNNGHRQAVDTRETTKHYLGDGQADQSGVTDWDILEEGEVWSEEQKREVLDVLLIKQQSDRNK